MTSAPSGGGNRGPGINRAEVERLRSTLLALMRSRFLRTASHELRTPLTSILGYAMTLEKHWDELDDATKRECVHAMREQAGELSTAVERLLEAARAELEGIK